MTIWGNIEPLVEPFKIKYGEENVTVTTGWGSDKY